MPATTNSDNLTEENRWLQAWQDWKG